MTDNTNDKDFTGYKNPPKSNQFRKGESGNPNGRPPNKRTIKRAFAEFLYEKVPVNQGGKRRKMSRIEIIFKAMHKKATTGNVRANKILDKWKQYIPSSASDGEIPSVVEYYKRSAITYSEYHRYLKRYNISNPEFEQKYAKEQEDFARARKELGLS